MVTLWTKMNNKVVSVTKCSPISSTETDSFCRFCLKYKEHIFAGLLSVFFLELQHTFILLCCWLLTLISKVFHCQNSKENVFKHILHACVCHHCVIIIIVIIINRCLYFAQKCAVLKIKFHLTKTSEKVSGLAILLMATRGWLQKWINHNRLQCQIHWQDRQVCSLNLFFFFLRL